MRHDARGLAHPRRAHHSDAIDFGRVERAHAPDPRADACKDPRKAARASSPWTPLTDPVQALPSRRDHAACSYIVRLPGRAQKRSKKENCTMFDQDRWIYYVSYDPPFHRDLAVPRVG